jgi:hypothetical protein
MRASFRRRLIALVAAYAVALNALLPALAVAMPAGPEATAFSIICAAASLDSTSNGDSAPVGRGPGCLHGMACLMAGCGGIAALGSETRRANAFVLGTIPIVFVARPSHDGSVRRIFDGHFARAPPAV